MLETLKETLKCLNLINNSLSVKKKLSSHKITEHQERLKRLEDSIRKYKNYLANIDERNLTKEKIKKTVITIHIELMNLINSADQLDDLLSEISKNI